jgi:succinate dehydrogenase / fumarate reductase membrane anchor subunit
MAGPAGTSQRTPLGRVRGLGAAGQGVGGYLRQRLGAVGLLILAPWFVLSAIRAASGGHEGVVAWLQQPVNAVGVALFILVACFHMRIGMNTIIEDYIQKSGSRLALLALNALVVVAAGVAGLYAVMMIGFGN